MASSLPELRTVNVTRYVTPLREGGSLPAIAEADDNFLYVLKFRGAGQGVKALIAELVAGEIARMLGLRVPELVFANLDEAFGRTEPDEEIQDLLKASAGLNLALHYLSGAITFDPVVTNVDAKLASQIVWLDCLITNVDRTVRNTNMLVWHNELWLIDHGAALYFHHSWQNFEEQARRPFVQVKDHVLLPQATELEMVDAEFRSILTANRIHSIVSLIPDGWLADDSFQVQQARNGRCTFSFWRPGCLIHTFLSMKLRMQEKHLFEYAVIRVVPRVERGEFLNAGVVVYCSSQRFLQTRFTLNEERLRAFSPDVDLATLEKRLRAFEQICKGAAEGGPIGRLPIASRFRWLTAARSTVVQTSQVHPGFCFDAADTLVKLYTQLVQ